MSVHPLDIGEDIGPYRLVRLLGSGGQGSVYQAERVGTGGLSTQLAIKVLPPLPGDSKSTERRYQDFLHEAYLLTRMHHSHVVTVFEVTKLRGFPAIVMEYVEGTSLAEHISQCRLKGEPPDVAWSLRVVEQCARALSYAATLEDSDGKPLRIVHRDIKPANILLGTDGTAKLGDFGLARSDLSNREQTAQGILKGTVKYMSPEQAMCKPMQSQSDIFSLGVVLYELITLQSPFGVGPETATGPYLVAIQMGAREVEQRVEALSEFCEPLAELLDGMLAYNVDTRIANAKELLPLIEEVRQKIPRDLRYQFEPIAENTQIGASNPWATYTGSGHETTPGSSELSANSKVSESFGSDGLDSVQNAMALADGKDKATEQPSKPLSSSPASTTLQLEVASPSAHRGLYLFAGVLILTLFVGRQLGIGPNLGLIDGAMEMLTSKGEVDEAEGPLEAKKRSPEPAPSTARVPALSASSSQKEELELRGKTDKPPKLQNSPVSDPPKTQKLAANDKKQPAQARKLNVSEDKAAPKVENRSKGTQKAEIAKAKLTLSGMPAAILELKGYPPTEVSVIEPMQVEVPSGKLLIKARDVATGEIVWQSEELVEGGRAYNCRWDGGNRWAWSDGRAVVNQVGCQPRN